MLLPPTTTFMLLSVPQNLFAVDIEEACWKNAALSHSPTDRFVYSAAIINSYCSLLFPLQSWWLQGLFHHSYVLCQTDHYVLTLHSMVLPFGNISKLSKFFFYFWYFLKTILTPFRGIESQPSASSVVAAGAVPLGYGWLGGIRPHHQVPSMGFDPRTTASRVQRSIDWAT